MSNLNLQLNDVAYQNFGFNVYLTKDTLDLDEEIPASEANQVFTTWSIGNSSIEGVGVNKLETGTITSQTITLAVEDGAGDTYIASGKTDFDNTTAGFILGVDDSDSNKPKFYIGDATSYVNWDGSTLTIAGGITTDTAFIGALTLGDGTTNGTITFNHTDTAGDTYIAAGKTDFTNTQTGFILGIDDSDADTAKFFIGDTTSYFNWDGSAMTINTPVITNIATGTEIAIQGWVHDMTFSASDADTVAWSSGTITLTNGVAYSIDAGNTGNMSVTNYVYLDIGTSTTVLQATTTVSTATGSGKILVATCKNSTTNASFQVFGGPKEQKLSGADLEEASLSNSKIVANSITASEIASNTITANEIAATTITASEIAADTITANELAANSVTATEINVTNLAAINADMGAITAGTVTLNTSGHIKGGQTAYNTGTGFWMGYDTSAYKFSIGDPSGDYLTWDGSKLTFTGLARIMTAGATINGATLPVPVYQNPSDNEVYACDGNDTAKLKFIGFAISNSTDGNSITVQVTGPISGFTGLTEGVNYFVQDAVGTIGTTKGTYPVLVGVATSATEIKIISENDEGTNVEFIASDVLRASLDTERRRGGVALEKIKEFGLKHSGTVRTKFDLKSQTGGTTVKGQIWVNGVAVGTLQTNDTTTYATKTQDISGINSDDEIQLYIGESVVNAYARNFRLYWDKISVGDYTENYDEGS